MFSPRSLIVSNYNDIRAYNTAFELLNAFFPCTFVCVTCGCDVFNYFFNDIKVVLKNKTAVSLTRNNKCCK